MKIIDGLVFTDRAFSNGTVNVMVECRSEGGKVVNQNTQLKMTGSTRELTVERGIKELIEWFERHTRPDPINLTSKAPLTHPDRFKRPYRPAGYLRRLTQDEINELLAKASST